MYGCAPIIIILAKSVSIRPAFKIFGAIATMNVPIPSAPPRFAVCLAAYNGSAYVAEQVNSILAQRGVHLHIFVSVDVSTDGTEAILRKWASTEERLTVLPGGRRFGGAGPNFYRLLQDVDLRDFDYLSFADQDDIWHPEKLRRAHTVLNETGAAGYSSNFTAFWPTGVERFVNKASAQRAWDFLFESAGPGCTYVLRTDLAMELQNFIRGADAQTLKKIDYHDWLTYAFARSRNFRWEIDSWSSMRYRQHANNQIGVNAGWRSFWLRAGKVVGGYGFAQSALIEDLIGPGSTSLNGRPARVGRLGYLSIALRARHCRRRSVDQVLFFISCLILAIVNPSMSQP